MSSSLAYGDSRTNGSAHNTIAGRVMSLFQADPAFQTLELNVGDWVSTDTESAWSGEWYNPSYTNIRAQDASIAETGVRGNHESGATYFKRYWPQPYQPGGLYRSFDYGPVHVAMLDQYTSYSAGSTQHNWLKDDLRRFDKDRGSSWFCTSRAGRRAVDTATIRPSRTISNRYSGSTGCQSCLAVTITTMPA